MKEDDDESDEDEEEDEEDDEEEEIDESGEASESGAKPDDDAVDASNIIVGKLHSACAKTLRGRELTEEYAKLMLCDIPDDELQAALEDEDFSDEGEEEDEEDSYDDDDDDEEEEEGGIQGRSLLPFPNPPNHR